MIKLTVTYATLSTCPMHKKLCRFITELMVSMPNIEVIIVLALARTMVSRGITLD